MALRDQPYLPLYIQDIMTDEKLNECSAATHGVYIKGIMCLMHKSETYGKILLKQKYKQNESKEKNFALMLANHLPYTFDVILAALTELINEGVCHYEDDYLCQKRMIKDGELSVIRSLSGKKGGESSKKKAHDFAQAKPEAKSEANPEYENEYEIDNNTLHNLQDNKVKLSEKIEKNGEKSKTEHSSPIYLSGADRLAKKLYEQGQLDKLRKTDNRSQE